MKKILLKISFFIFLTCFALFLPYLLYGANCLIQKFFGLLSIESNLKEHYVEYSVASLSTFIGSFIAFFTYRIEKKVEQNDENEKDILIKASAKIVLDNLNSFFSDVHYISLRCHKESDFRIIKSKYKLDNIESHLYRINHLFNKEQFKTIENLFVFLNKAVIYDSFDDNLYKIIDASFDEIYDRDKKNDDFDKKVIINEIIKTLNITIGKGD